MKPEIAKLWIEDLRSGAYEQCQGTLRKNTEDGPKHCCLGVLCERAIKEGVEIITDIDEYGDYTYNGRSCMPPEVVHEWSGLNGDDPEDFAAMNDINGKTFAEIADEAERRFLKGGENNNG
jgi:hypothetical protein